MRGRARAGDGLSPGEPGKQVGVGCSWVAWGGQEGSGPGMDRRGESEGSKALRFYGWPGGMQAGAYSRNPVVTQREKVPKQDLKRPTVGTRYYTT